jgi:hypothetical protein
MCWANILQTYPTEYGLFISMSNMPICPEET